MRPFYRFSGLNCVQFALHDPLFTLFSVGLVNKFFTKLLKMKRKSRARNLDQFYTRRDVAATCLDQLRPFVNASFDAILEPSCGTGAFLNQLDRLGLAEAKRYWCDVDENVVDKDHLCNYLTSPPVISPSAKRVLVVGNPPFTHTVDFFNACATKEDNVDCIAMILPKSIKKPSVMRRLDPHFAIVHEWLALPSNSFVFEDNPYDVNCGFFIFMRLENGATRPLPPPLPTKHADFR